MVFGNLQYSTQQAHRFRGGGAGAGKKSEPDTGVSDDLRLLVAPMGVQQLTALEAEAIEDDDQGVRFDLVVHAFEEGERVRLYWVYNRDLFDQWRMEQMARHYVRVLEAVVPDIDRSIQHQEISGSSERQTFSETFNDVA